VQEKDLAKQLFIYHIPALDQSTGVLTQSLSSARFVFLRDNLNVMSFSFEKSSP